MCGFKHVSSEPPCFNVLCRGNRKFGNCPTSKYIVLCWYTWSWLSILDLEVWARRLLFCSRQHWLLWMWLQKYGKMFMSKMMRGKRQSWPLIMLRYHLRCLKDGLEILVGHIDMHLFRFFVDLVGWCVMQYKVSLNDAMWSPKDGHRIWLWQNRQLKSFLATIRTSKPYSFSPYMGEWCHQINWERKKYQ